MTPSEMGSVPHDYHGHSLDWLFKARGILGVEVELGHCWNDAGLTNELWLAWQEGARDGNDAQGWTRQVLRDWDERRRQATATGPGAAAGAAPPEEAEEEPTICADTWEPFAHPQLGPVEIGGIHWTTLVSAITSHIPGRLTSVQLTFELTMAFKVSALFASIL